jgi:hypothetical protein
MTKFCGVCKEDKSVLLFAKNSNKKDGLQNCCKPCQAKYGKARYEGSKELYRERNRKLKIRNQIAIYEWLQNKACVDCEVDNPVVLTFDHNPDKGKKKLEVSNMVKQSWGLQTIFDEIAKCEIRCFNCHMIKDSLRRGGKKWNALNAVSSTE